jgi:energy-coupling factor transport system ATP-binding protein
VAGGTAVLAAEHQPELLARASRTLLLDRGRVLADDRPAVALAPEHAVAAGYEPPPILALAAAAGVAPSRAFDKAAVAEALREASERRAPGWPPPWPTSASPVVTWPALREHPPTTVEVEGLVHRYPNGVVALHGVDLAVTAGEAVAIVGANGSGKTTLVKHLNGLLRPSAGSVRVGGADVATQPVHRNAASIGFAFADAEEMLFGRSVEAELRFGPRALRLPADETARLVEAALAATGLADRRTANPHDLVRADQRVVALAAILAADPAVVVLDEPTSGLDGGGVHRVVAILDALRRAGRTVVAVTHDMELAARHFDRVVVLREGRVVLSGPPGVVFAPDRAAALAEAGVRPPLAARIAARVGVEPVPLDVPDLLDRLARQPPGPRAARAS